MKHQFTKKNIVLAIGLVLFGIVGRLLLQSFPNIETVMVVSIIAGAILGPYFGFAVGLFTVVGSDMFIGNSSILVYTWSAWAIIGASSTLAKRKKDQSAVITDTLKFTGWGVLGTLFFFLWTNFGVWHLGSMYPHTAAGLMQSYIMGLPFLRFHMVSTLTIVPVVSFTFLAVRQYVPVAIRAWRSAKA